MVAGPAATARRVLRTPRDPVMPVPQAMTRTNVSTTDCWSSRFIFWQAAINDAREMVRRGPSLLVTRASRSKIVDLNLMSSTACSQVRG